MSQANCTIWRLFNNSAVQEILLVWQLGITISTGDVIQTSMSQETSFGTLGTVQAVYPIDAVPPGVVSCGNRATRPAADFVFLGTAEQETPFWPNDFPFAVIPPGWALNIADNTTATAPIQACAWWEAITPGDYKLRFGGLLVDPTI